MRLTSQRTFVVFRPFLGSAMRMENFTYLDEQLHLRTFGAHVDHLMGMIAWFNGGKQLLSRGKAG